MFQPDLFADQINPCGRTSAKSRVPHTSARAASRRRRPSEAGQQLGLPDVLERLAQISARPRYTFMVLNLIARAAGGTDSAGPYVREGNELIGIRDWLSDALVPMAQRDPRRLATEKRVRTALMQMGGLPSEPALVDELVAAELRVHLRQSGRTNVSRAVSDLVRAGLLQRHYQGYRIDHENRGAQREAVYTIRPEVRHALGQVAQDR